MVDHSFGLEEVEVHFDYLKVGEDHFDYLGVGEDHFDYLGVEEDHLADSEGVGHCAD